MQHARQSSMPEQCHKTITNYDNNFKMNCNSNDSFSHQQWCHAVSRDCAKFLCQCIIQRLQMHLQGQISSPGINHLGNGNHNAATQPGTNQCSLTTGLRQNLDALEPRGLQSIESLTIWQHIYGLVQSGPLACQREHPNWGRTIGLPTWTL